MAGVKAITSNVSDDDAAIAMTERLAEEFDINIAIHNHGQKHRWGSTEQLDELFGKTSKRFGLCLDTAWMLDAGGDPLAAVDKYADRLMGVHLKDFTFDADGKAQDVIVGTGGLNLLELMRKLNAMDYSGYMSLEYEGDVDAPLPSVMMCLGAIRTAIDAM